MKRRIENNRTKTDSYARVNMEYGRNRITNQDIVLSAKFCDVITGRMKIRSIENQEISLIRNGEFSKIFEIRFNIAEKSKIFGNCRNIKLPLALYF